MPKKAQFQRLFHPLTLILGNGIVVLLLGGTPIYGQGFFAKGQVLDAASGFPIPFATVYVEETMEGTTTDLEGHFELKLAEVSDSLTAVSLGYTALSMPIQGDSSLLRFHLVPSFLALDEIVVQAGRKAPKDTAAIALYRRVVKHKQQNSIYHLEDFQYEEYQKTQYDIYQIKEGFINKKLFKPFQFLYTYVDSTESGIPYLPVLLREQLKKVYYQKIPLKRKEILLADQFSGVRDYYKWQLADLVFEDIDIYQNIIPIQNKTFISPFSDGALAYYKFFLTDSMEVEGDPCYKLEFTPRREGDLAFGGHVWIHHPTAAIYQVQAWLPENMNLNFVSAMALKQDFAQISGKQWFKQHEVLSVHLNVTQKDKHQNIRILQTKSRKNISANKTIPPSYFRGETFAMNPLVWSRDSSYWEKNRHLPLKTSEYAIFEMIDTLKTTRAYKNLFRLIHLGKTGYLQAGPIEFGPWYRFLSWNALEGIRYKIGVKNEKFLFNEKFHFNAYAAYGDKDKLWKYHGGLEYHLPRKHFLWNSISGHYRFDWSYDYVYNPWWSHDHLVQSVFRKYPLENLFLFREGHIQYNKEWVKGLIQQASLTHKTVYDWPSAYEFRTSEGDTLGQFETVELGVITKWQVRLKNKEKRKISSPFHFAAPYLESQYVFGPKGILGSDFNYHKLVFGLKQQLYTGLGRTQVEASVGKLFGKVVPYPLLQIHQGNRSYLYNPFAFNMMNDYEYASDTWASLWLEHRFEGLLFNAIPWLRKLKLRNFMTSRMVVGSLRQENKDFLQEAYGLAEIQGAYVEAGWGVDNIARVLRVDFLFRLTQLKQTDSRLFGLRIWLKPKF